MREYLFRGKLTANGEWSEGNLVVNKRGICIITPDETPIGTYGQVDPETVGQYTGLRDKNGKKIFEGDILKAVDDLGHSFIGEVVFKSGSYQIKYKNRYFDTYSYHRIGHIGHWQDMGASGTVTYSYRQIGNIHDNPETLKGSENK